MRGIAKRLDRLAKNPSRYIGWHKQACTMQRTQVLRIPRREFFADFRGAVLL